MILNSLQDETLFDYSKRMVQKLQDILYVENIIGCFDGIRLEVTPFCTPCSVIKQYEQRKLSLQNNLLHQLCLAA